MKGKLLLALAVVLPFLSSAQDIWSLEQCIQYALDNNIDVKLQKLNLERNENNLMESRGSFLPNVNGSASHRYSWGRNYSQITNDIRDAETVNQDFSLTSQVNVFTGFRNYNGLRQSQINILSAKEDIKNVENNVSLNIASTYLDILFNTENLANAKRQAAITKQQVSRMEKLVQAGSSPKGDLLQVKSQLANEELSIINAENNLNLSYLALKQSLLLPVDQEMVVATAIDLNTDVLSLPTGTTAAVQNAFDNYPSIMSLNYQLSSSDKGILIAKGAALPTVSIGAGLVTSYSNRIVDVLTNEKVKFNDQVSDNFNKYLSFNLNVPIFSRFTTYTSISNAKINRSNTELQLEREKNTVRQNIERAYADAMAAFNKYNATQKSLESFEEAFRYAQQRFEVGLINAVDNNTAKNNLTKAQSDLLQSKYEYIFRLKILDFYQGKPLTLKSLGDE